MSVAMDGRGLAGWVLTAMGRMKARSSGERHLEVLETVQLGAKKQLVLVSCDGQRFLVGTGADNVGTIVRVSDAGEAR